ncbi:hypothetical protein BC826DRAFT_973381 [Russula brevipes]|nr:hypothetical protein BC826DRAFT_973381 [Russula brevipes]
MSQSPEQPPTSHLPSVPELRGVQPEISPSSSQALSGQREGRVYSVPLSQGYTLSATFYSKGGTNQPEVLPIPVPAGAGQTQNDGAPDKSAADDTEGPFQLYIHGPVDNPGPWPFAALPAGENHGWEDSALLRALEMGREALRDHEGRGRVYWIVWMELQRSWMCPSCQDSGGRRWFVNDRLRQYSWYRGDTTVDEAISAMTRFDEIDRAIKKAVSGVQPHGYSSQSLNKDKEEGKQEGEKKRKANDDEGVLRVVYVLL